MGTHKVPTAKTQHSNSFFLKGSCSFLMTRIGRPMTHSSLVILNTALAYQNMVRLMQCPPPGIFFLNAYRTGVHWKMLEKTDPTVKAVMMAMRT